ncbi:hypothetical protein GCM10010402_49650 [Actinomadura luteofluorescens]|nr:hypothetical protein [Actinomadura glauciflava]
MTCQTATVTHRWPWPSGRSATASAAAPRPAVDFLNDHARILTALACDPDLRVRDIVHDIGQTERAAQLITTDEEGRSAGAAQERGRARSVIIRAFVAERNFLDRT